jgi:hypothetical protein
MAAVQHAPFRYLLVVFLALLALPLFAQTDRGVIEVLVLDSSEGVIPGVTVTLTHPDTGARVVEWTGANGLARFVALRPGTYAVRAELSGFGAVTEETLPLRIGQTNRVSIILQPEASETITVHGTSSVVDVYRSDTSSNITPEQIESLPVADRDFQKLAFIAPGVQRERGGFRFIGGGPVIGASSNASQATILVDGVDYTDPALGLSRTRFSQDAIREFRVIQNRFDPEIGGSSGGALSIVTKSGTNNLDGTVFGFFRDKSLREPGALEQDDLDYSRYQIGFTLGGPITRDRTHFFFSYEYIDEDNITLVRPGGAFAGLATDVAHPFTHHLAFASLDHQINNQQSLMGKFVYDTYDEENFRVGGIADVSYGQKLERDNWNVTAGHTWIISAGRLNELRVQGGHHKYFEPTNSKETGEWFSSGTTLQTGSNILGDLLGEGDFIEVRNTYHMSLADGRHHLKGGIGVQWIDERSDIPVYQDGLMIWVFDNRALPLAYAFGTGSSDVTVDTTIYSAFLQDEWRPTASLTLNLGVRYDYNTDANNPDFRHPLVPNGRKADSDNIQPRLGFTWDPTARGDWIIRGGAGRFTGRYLLVPAFTELQQNGVSGRVLQTRLNGLLLGLPQFALDPANPRNTGIPLPADITLLDTKVEAPESDQFSLGFTRRLGESGIYLDVEGLWVEGNNELIIRDRNWRGNHSPGRPNPAWNQINVYSNEGHSEYKALIVGLNGMLARRHILAGSVTFADRKNINDDFSPEFPFGYPNDPADIGAEYGRSRADETYRIVLSGVFQAPWDLTIAPVWEYGSGQPWNRRLGYDFNGDGKNSDRAPGVKRNDEDGPRFTQLNLRVSKGLNVFDRRMNLIAEAFNLLDTTNYDVNSIDSAEFLAGPTLANPAAVAVPNPNFGKFRATMPGREIQLGVNYSF